VAGPLPGGHLYSGLTEGIEPMHQQLMVMIDRKRRRSFIMMRSMFSGVSGLQAHQTKMDVIGNNVANVNTVGFK